MAQKNPASRSDFFIACFPYDSKAFSSVKFLYELFWRQDWYITQSIIFSIACYDEISSCRFGTLYLQAILKVSKYPIFQSCAQLLSINSLYLQNFKKSQQKLAPFRICKMLSKDIKHIHNGMSRHNPLIVAIFAS